MTLVKTVIRFIKHNNAILKSTLVEREVFMYSAHFTGRVRIFMTDNKTYYEFETFMHQHNYPFCEDFV